jgi:hypothetical protein
MYVIFEQTFDVWSMFLQYVIMYISSQQRLNYEILQELYGYLHSYKHKVM